MDNATYAVVDMSKKIKQKNMQDDTAVDSSYSVITPQYMDNPSNSLPDNTATANTESNKADKEEANSVKKVSKHESVKFVSIIATIVVLALIMLIFIAVLFGEIMNLKNQNDSLRQQLSLSQVQSQQQAFFSSSEFQILQNQTSELRELFHQLSNDTNTLSEALVGQYFPHPAISHHDEYMLNMVGHGWVWTLQEQMPACICNSSNSGWAKFSSCSCFLHCIIILPSILAVLVYTIMYTYSYR